MRKTRDVCKKSGDIKGGISCNNVHNKGQKCKDLTKAEEIKKKWQEYTEELYKKDLNNLDKYDGVVNSRGVRHPGM